MSCLSFPLAREGWKPRWEVSEKKSAELVKGLQGHRGTGGLSERSVVRGKRNHLSFYSLPQSHAVWISLTLRLTLKSCSNLTLEWNVTTWLPSTWDMALRFRSVLKPKTCSCTLLQFLSYNIELLIKLWTASENLHLFWKIFCVHVGLHQPICFFLSATVAGNLLFDAGQVAYISLSEFFSMKIAACTWKWHWWELCYWTKSHKPKNNQLKYTIKPRTAECGADLSWPNSHKHIDYSYLKKNCTVRFFKITLQKY